MIFDYSDIQPVELNTETPQLCQIIYDDEYKSTMGVLLALMKKKEYSLRALELTKQGIEQLASHYTIWIYRYDIIKHLMKEQQFDLYSELDWCEQVALDNEKNYQIWNYRQLIITEILNSKHSFNPDREYPIMEAMLDVDPKNHHVWSFRKWLVEKFELYKDEKEVRFVNDMIELDVKNNSAWCHRFFIKFRKDSSEKEIEKEIEYVKGKIILCPQNPSSWNYLIGIYNKFDYSLVNLKQFCLQFVIGDGDDVSVKSTFALENLSKIHELELNYQDAIENYNLLKEKFDPIRCNYWDYKINQINVKVNN